MQTIDPQTTVGDLVRQSPNRARVFESHKIDFCCGGKVPLAEAATAQQLELPTLLRELLDADSANQDSDVVNVDTMSLSELADHIEQTHHAFLRSELPRLDQMTEKVSRVHGDKEPRLNRVREAFVALKDELEPHMLKEEQILFPMVRQLENQKGLPVTGGNSIANPIEQMEHEHDQAGAALAVLRESTDDYTPPEWACNTYRAMLDGLERLERDMHQHVHKENNVLFAKSLQLAPTLK